MTKEEVQMHLVSFQRAEKFLSHCLKVRKATEEDDELMKWIRRNIDKLLYYNAEDLSWNDLEKETTLSGEYYVSFQTAEMLKEKGFNERCESLYNDDGTFTRTFPCTNKDLSEGVYSRPLLCQVQKWFRDRNIEVDSQLFDSEHGWFFYEQTFDDAAEAEDYNGSSSRTYATYEEALDRGLRDALKLIKTE